MEEWRVIADAREYEINRAGDIRNTKTGRVLKPSKNRHGRRQVVLMDAGVRIGRSVDGLVKEAFG